MGFKKHNVQLPPEKMRPRMAEVVEMKRVKLK